MKPSPLLVIAVIFATSFTGRLVGVANATLNAPKTESVEKTGAEKLQTEKSHAKEPSDTMDAKMEEKAHEPVMKKPAAAMEMNEPMRTPTPVLAMSNPGDEDRLLSAIRERSAMLDEQETNIEERMRMLEVIESRIDDKLVALENSNNELSKLVSYADESSQKDIDLLARMYEQMKPQKAGEIFDKMDPKIAAGFLTQMNSESAALILANMNTDKAFHTSMIIASRNAAVHQ